jgi:hypothetical protein
MRPRLDELLEPDGFVLEVDPLDVRPRREPAPVRDDELEALRERPLCRPGCVAVDDAAVDEEDAGTVDPAILWTDTKYGGNRMLVGNRCVTSGPVSSDILARLMQAASPSSFDPAGAGGLLLGVLALCIGLGVLIGWLAGGAGIGALLGSVVGIVAGTFAVYRRYRGAI